MFTCIMCKTDFTTRQYLYSHLIAHKNNLGCTKCDHISRTRKDRRNHAKMHHPINCFTCKKPCEKMHLNEHRKSHEYLYSVDQLNGIVDIIDKIRGNNTEPFDKTNDDKQFTGTAPICPVNGCNKKFTSQNELINHFIDHRQNHRCKYCQEIFPNTQRYNEHFSNKICRYYTCLNCQKEFSFEKFIPHIMNECTENLFNNEEIPKSIVTLSKRKVYRIFNETQYCFTCFVCEDEFATMQLLHSHLIMHNKQLNVCAKCFCIFEEERKLKDHGTHGCEADLIKGHEELFRVLKTYLDDCKQSTSYLQTHIKVYEMFGDLVLFQCNVCNSKFVRFKYLTEHCDVYNHDLILCYGCCFMFNTWDEHHKHYCVKNDYHSINEMNFRKAFHENQFLIDANKTETRTGSTLYKNVCNVDVITRMTNVIQKLENVKIPKRKDTSFCNVTPITTTSSTESTKHNTNDEFDLDKILPRVMELRRNRICKEEVREIGDDLNNLNISKRHLLDENTEHEIIDHHKKRNNEDDETIDNISKFLEDFDEPPNKKLKIDVKDDEYLDEFNQIIEDAQQDSSDEEIPNKLRKY